MNQKRKYRHFILFCLVLDLLAVVFLGYRYLDRKIPDEIHIDRNSGLGNLNGWSIRRSMFPPHRAIMSWRRSTVR